MSWVDSWSFSSSAFMVFRLVLIFFKISLLVGVYFSWWYFHFQRSTTGFYKDGFMVRNPWYYFGSIDKGAVVSKEQVQYILASFCNSGWFCHNLVKIVIFTSRCCDKRGFATFSSSQLMSPKLKSPPSHTWGPWGIRDNVASSCKRYSLSSLSGGR